MAGTRLPVKEEGAAAHQGSALSSWHPFDNIRRDFDRLFDELDRSSWGSFLPRLTSSLPALGGNGMKWMVEPVVDIVENDKSYEITAEMPGMDEKNIEVSLVDGSLSIRGEKREEAKDESSDHYMRERRYGAVERTFGLPDNVNADKIDARYANGVLRVTLPKDPNMPSAKKRIDVRPG